MIRHFLVIAFAAAVSFASIASAAEEKKAPAAIAIAKIKHSGPVDFEREVLPILKANCLACHNKTTTKADLILETPQDMLKGGESGRAVSPKNGADSLLIKMAAHQKKPSMPPRDNKVAASDLTPEELGLIKLWIDQGAKGSVRAAGPVEWKPLAENLNAIFAVALTSDGQFAAAARANQIDLYHLPSGRQVGRLTDSSLAKTNLYAQTGAAHRDMVESLAFSPDGRILASGSYREVKLWRRETNVVQFNFAKAAQKSVEAVAISPDGQWLATGGDDGAIKLWDLQKGKPARTLSGHTGEISALKFSPDGTRLLSGSADKSLRLWTIADGKLFAHQAMPEAVNAVAWLGSHQIAVGGADPVIHLWQTPTAANGQWIAGKELKGHAGAITGLEGTGTNQLFSSSADGALRQWDLTKYETVRELKHGGAIAGMAARPDGKRVATVGTNQITKLWNLEKSELLAELKGDRYAQEALADKQRNSIFATNELAFRKSSFQAATNARNAALERVKKAKDADDAAAKVVTEKEKPFKDTTDARAAAEKAVMPLNDELKVATEAADKAAKQAEADVAATKAKTNADKAAAEKAVEEANTKSKAAGETKKAADKKLAEAKDKQKQANDKFNAADKAWKDAEAALKKAQMGKSNTAHELELANLAAGKSEEAVNASSTAITTSEGSLKQAETELSAAQKNATDTEKPWRAVAFSRDGLTLATAGDDQMVHTWSAETGAAYEHYKGHTAPVLALAFGTGNMLISGAADRSALVWDTREKWKLTRTIGSGDAASPLVDRVNALRFSPDGLLLATGGGEPTRGGEIKLWQWATGKLAQSFTNVHSDAVFSLDFSPDGKYLASGAADKFLRVVDLGTGKVVKSFEGHTHHVLGVSWKRDGRTLASSGADNVVKIWDFVTGDRKKNVEGFNKEVTSISFVGITDQALASSGDNQVRLVNEKGEQVRAFTGGTDFMDAAAVTPDGRIVIAGGQDSVLRVWNGTNGQVMATFEPAKK